MKWIIAVVVVLLFAVPSFAEVEYLGSYPSCDTIEQLVAYTVALVADSQDIILAMEGVCGIVPQHVVDDAVFDIISEQNGIIELLVSYEEGATIIWTFSNNVEVIDTAF